MSDCTITKSAMQLTFWVKNCDVHNAALWFVMRNRVGQFREWHNPHVYCLATCSVANTAGQLCRRQTDMNTEYQCSPKRRFVHHKSQSTAVKLYQPSIKILHHIHVEIHAPARHSSTGPQRTGNSVTFI